MNTMHPLSTGEQLALPLPAGAEVFCASGTVRLLVVTGAFDAALSLELTAGRGWRSPERSRVLLTARAPSRVLVHEPQRPAKSPAMRGFPEAVWSRLTRVRRAA